MPSEVLITFSEAFHQDLARSAFTWPALGHVMSGLYHSPKFFGKKVKYFVLQLVSLSQKTFTKIFGKGFLLPLPWLVATILEAWHQFFFNFFGLFWPLLSVGHAIKIHCQLIRDILPLQHGLELSPASLCSTLCLFAQGFIPFASFRTYSSPFSPGRGCLWASMLLSVPSCLREAWSTSLCTPCRAHSPLPSSWRHCHLSGPSSGTLAG